MGFAVRVYEAFKDDEVKAKVLAEFIEKVEEAISNNQVATRQDLSLQELKLTKEIKDIELRLTKEIEQLRADLTKEIEQVRADLTKEIEQVKAELRLEIEKVRVEIHQVKSDILKWLIGLLLTQTITIVGIIAGLFQVLK
ncbi:MAG: DUF1640 domain-containing protein [Spirochaetota bacterium]